MSVVILTTTMKYSHAIYVVAGLRQRFAGGPDHRGQPGTGGLR